MHSANARTFGLETNAFWLATPSVAIELEGVGDSVPYSPNLPDGGFAVPQNRQRYIMQSVSVDWPIAYGPTLHSNITQHELNSFRDNINVNQISFGISKALPIQNLAHPITLDFRLQHSFTDRFEKNSYTHTDRGLIKSADIHEPKDIDAAFALRYQFYSSNSISLFTNTTIGFQKTQYKKITGNGVSDEGCELDFELLASGGTLTQSNVCGQVQSYQQIFPDDVSLQKRLGVQPRAEMQYQAWYFEQNLSLSKAFNSKTRVNAGYSARLYLRSKIDDTNFGYEHKPVTLSHIFKVDIQHKLTKRLSVGLGANYQFAPFLDKVPFLYTRYTAHRYDGSSPSFTLSARYNFY